jgi:hypothetical protein
VEVTYENGSIGACLGLVLFSMVMSRADQLPLPDPQVFMYGQTPDAQVKSWIRLAVLGARDKPFPVIFISPQRFKSPGFPEVHIVLRGKEYRALSVFTRTKRCSIGVVERPAWGTLLITEYRDGHSSNLCVMPPEASCDYLSTMSMLASINWTSTQLEPIHELADAIKCNEHRSADAKTQGNIPADH